MGNILIIKEGLETSSIPENCRNQAILDFFNAKDYAEKRGHRYYIEEGVFIHTFSYGNYFPGFVNMSYAQICSIPSLSGIEQTTFQLLQYYITQTPNPSVSGEDFVNYNLPKAASGFRRPDYSTSNYISDFRSLCEWEIVWYSKNPGDIEWKEDMNEFMPRPDLTQIILMHEINAYKHKDEVADLLKKKYDTKHIFHNGIVAYKGTELSAYFKEIAHKVLSANYYKHEDILSHMESKHVHTQRYIYSLITKSGKRHFISLDCAHGMLEICNEYGDHIGEFRIDGSSNSPATPETHSLNCVKDWLKRRHK